MFSPTLTRKLQRARRFFNVEGRGKLLIQIAIDGQELATCQVLPEHLAGDWPAYLREKAAEFASFVQSREWLEDDWFPVLHPWFGASELVAYLPNPVEFGSETSWTIPEIASVRVFRRPPLNATAPHLRQHLAVLAFCRDAARERYLVGLRGTFGPLEVASTLVGSSLLYELSECPEQVDELLDFCVEGAIWHFERQFEVVGMLQGGTIDAYLQLWIPGKVAGHMSNDFPCLISPSMYRRFGYPADARVFAHFDGGQMHTHNLGWHQLSQFASVPGLKLLEIAEDPNVIPTAQRLPELFARVGETPVYLHLSVKDFREHIDEFHLGNAVVRINEAVERAEALDLLRLARSHSKIT